jgi:hypothetical protein
MLTRTLVYSPCLCLLAFSVIMFAETRLGKPLTQQQSVPIGKILSSPESFVDKTVQVKGTVTEVCEMMGCWMNLVDADNKSLRVKVNDGEIVFPKSAIGKTAVAEGKFVRLALTREQTLARARHEAEEQGRKFDPRSIKSGTTIYQIQGSAALIFE